MSSNPFETVPNLAASHIKRQDLPTHVRRYAYNLAAQIKEVYAKYGAKNFEELKDNKKLSAQDARKVADLLKAFQKAVEKKEVKPGLQEAIEILGRENVHGIEDVEAMLGDGFVDISKVPDVPYTTEDFVKSKEIKEKTGVEEMLVLFVADKDGTPLTGERMNGLIQAEYDRLEIGKFLSEEEDSVEEYEHEDFFTKLGLSYEWKLVTKQTIPDSKNRRHHQEDETDYRFTHQDTQEYAIEEYAKKLDIPRDQLHRPEPFQMLYATALHLIATERLLGKGKGERILENENHWSDVIDSNELLVVVGTAGSDGATVYMDSYDGRFGNLGVCLSREPSSTKSLDT